MLVFYLAENYIVIILELFQAVFSASFVIFMVFKVLLRMFRNITYVTYVLFVDFSVQPCIPFVPGHYQ